MMPSSDLIQNTCAKRNKYFTFKKSLQPLDTIKSGRHPKMHTSEVVSLRSSTSCPAHKLIISPVKIHKLSVQRVASAFALQDLRSTNDVPAKACEINSIINKKNRVLRIKHNVQDGSDPLPNLLEIKQSVKKEQVNFIRRMDKKLNTNGQANLLANLKQDLHIQCHNYLKEFAVKTRKHRNYLKPTIKQKGNDDFVVLPCQLPHEQHNI